MVPAPEIPHRIRIPGPTLRRDGEVERSVRLAARNLSGRGGVVLVVDCDDGCPPAGRTYSETTDQAAPRGGFRARDGPPRRGFVR